MNLHNFIFTSTKNTHGPLEVVTLTLQRNYIPALPDHLGNNKAKHRNTFSNSIKQITNNTN